jgi:hypothetical protein
VGDQSQLGPLWLLLGVIGYPQSSSHLFRVDIRSDIIAPEYWNNYPGPLGTFLGHQPIILDLFKVRTKDLLLGIKEGEYTIIENTTKDVTIRIGHLKGNILMRYPTPRDKDMGPVIYYGDPAPHSSREA